jgi:hypothetical protein
LHSISGKTQISVSDVTGKKVLPAVLADKPATPYSIPVDITKLLRGVYVVSIFMPGQKMLSATFIKL